MKQEKILITGALGFVGKHLAKLALAKGCEVHGIELKVPQGVSTNGVKIHKCDLCDGKAVNKTIRKINPARIFHLAAQSSVSLSWKEAKKTFEVNIKGQLNLFDAVLSSKTNPVIVIACSADEYGNPGKKNIPVKETTPLAPVSPYAISKTVQDLLAYEYNLRHGLKTVCIRAFTHTGPGRGEIFAESSFAKQIALIEAGRQEPTIKTGNLNAIRDFTDVRDFVSAYWAASEKCKYGDVYNICSGKGYRIRAVLAALLSMSKRKIRIEKDRDRLRPSDIPVLIGDNTKFIKQTGWKPKIGITETLKDLLDYHREKQRAGKQGAK